jgi:dTMP kinase
MALLREWLETKGYAVAATGLKRGKLAGKGIKSAMLGHTLSDTTMNLFYITDFADRLEQEIIPALRASKVVLLDRYLYSIIARAQVRGADPSWLRDIFGFALIPDVVFYLHADLTNLVPRVLNARGFSYWESGVDILRGRDYYDSYLEYQTRLLAQFDSIADEFGMIRVDANQSIHDVFQAIQNQISITIADMKTEKRSKKKGEEKDPAKQIKSTKSKTRKSKKRN